MSKNIMISVFAVLLLLSSILFVLNNNRAQRVIYAENQDSMSVEYILPENNVKFFSEIIELTDHQGQNYFVNYRIKREQMRQETKEMLWLLLESDIKNTREQAQKRWLELSDKIAKEGEIENILKIQGFKDVVSDVNGGHINITILTEILNPQEIKKIRTVAASVTGTTPEKIQVSAKF